MRMNVRRRIDGMLSEGRGAQLFWVFCIIVVSFFSLWGTSRVLFGTDAFSWQDIIALCLDPGVFNGPGEHDGFRLLITFVGIILFAATLISVVGNIFENISEQYKKGETRYHIKDHILIIGSGKSLLGLLRYLSMEQDGKYGTRDIVIMADRLIEILRDEIEASINNKKLLKRITFYYDKRDNIENLKNAYAHEAAFIFVIGEHNEENHDLLNLICLSHIRRLPTPLETECYVVMNSQTTMKAYQTLMNGIESKETAVYMTNEDNAIPHNESIININECCAEFLLKNTLFEFLNFKNDKPINIVVFGMTLTGCAIASTVAYSFHFRNRRNSIITIIDLDITAIAADFIARNHVLFNNCIYKIGTDISRKPVFEAPDTDIFWNFIDTPHLSLSLVEYLKNLLYDTEHCVYVCYDDIKKNLATEITLRNQIENLNIYADFGEYDDAFTMMGKYPSRTSKGFGCNSDEYYKYVFNDRQKDGIAHFLPDYHTDANDSFSKGPMGTNEKQADMKKWMALPFADKQKHIYEANAKRLTQITGPEVIDLNTCSDYVGYLMGVCRDGCGSSRFYISNKPNYMKIIEQHIYHPEHLPDYVFEFDNEDEAREDSLRVQNYYIKCLNNSVECNISEFLRFARGQVAYRLSFSLSAKLMDALLAYVKTTKILPDDAINALDDLIYAIEHDSTMVCRVMGESDIVDNFPDIDRDDNRAVLSIAKNIMEELAENANVQACLNMSYYHTDDYDKRKYWFTKAKAILKGQIIPSSYFNRIGVEVVEQLYLDTACDDCLDWIVVQKTPVIKLENFGKDYILSTEKYVHQMTNLSDEQLYFRLAMANGIQPSYHGMWLTKALHKAKENNNENLLIKVYLELGNYFNTTKKSLAGRYYQQAYELDKFSKDAIKLYGRYLFYGPERTESSQDSAIKIGYDPWDEPASFIEDYLWVLEDYYYPLERQESLEIDTHQLQYNVRKDEDEDEIELLVKSIKDWEIKYPNIEHPYQAMVEYYMHIYDKNDALSNL